MSLEQWRQLVDVLELNCDSDGLPTTGVCPFCGDHSFVIVADEVCGGQWYWCNECHDFGDTIQLAMRVWDMSAPAVFVRLSVNGVIESSSPDIVETYWEKTRKVRLKILEAIEAGSKRSRKNAGDILRLLGVSFAVPTGVGDSHFLSSMALSYSFEELKEFVPAKELKKLKLKNDSPVICLPFWEFPGKLAGFWAVAQNESCFLQIPFGQGLSPQKESPEKGLWWSRQAIGAAERSKSGVLIALDNPVEALKLQLAHWEQQRTAAPVIAWLPDDLVVLRRSWQSVRSLRTVLHSNSKRPEFLRQAVAINAEVSCVDVHSTPTATQTIRKILQSVTHWSDPVSEFLRDGDFTETEQWLTLLRQDHISPEEILRQCDADAQERCSGFFEEKKLSGRTRVNGRSIAEREHGWYLLDGNEPELVLEGSLRIDYLLKAESGDGEAYAGRIKFHGKEINFLAPRDVFDRAPGRWLQDYLLSLKEGFLRFHSKWQKLFVETAISFQCPELRTWRNRVGWCGEAAGFVFPAFFLRKDGVVQTATPELFSLSDNLPGSQLVHPMRSDKRKFKSLLKNDPASACGRAVMLAALSSILSPAYGKRPRQLLMVGDAAREIGLGLVRAWGGETPSESNWATFDGAHAWPYAPQRNGSLRCVAATSPTTEWSVMGAQGELAELFCLQGKSHVVYGEIDESLNQSFLEASTEFVPTYLHNLCCRNLQLANSKPIPWAEALAEDIDRFLNREDAGPGTFADALVQNTLFTKSGGNAQALVAVISRLLFTSRIEVSNLSEDENNYFVGVHVTPDFVELRLPKINKAIREVKIPAPDWEQISTLLAKENCLLGEDKGIIRICPNWWRNQCLRQGRRRTQQLRVFSDKD